MIEKTSPTLAVASIFKNEAPYILEWIAFHLSVGVNEFYIADNDSSDGSAEILQRLDEAGIIQYIPFPSPPGLSPQLPAYRKIIHEIGIKSDWVAFIDADEFLTPTDGSNSVKPTLERLTGLEKAGAIAVNWATYGSSQHEKYSPEPVTERFTRRAEKDFGVNRHYKSIARVKALQDVHENPHAFLLKDGYIYLHTDGEKLIPDVSGTLGLSAQVCWEGIRLNHYIIKSREEFIVKKNRGRATVTSTAGLNRTDAFFQGHDRNEVADPLGDAFKKTLQEERQKLYEVMLGAGLSHSQVMTSPLRISQIFSCLDRAELRGSTLEITGWVFSEKQEPVELCALLNDKLLEFAKVERHDRPDVERQIAGAPKRCGFKIEVLLPKELDETATHEIIVCSFSQKILQPLKKSSSYKYPLDGIKSEIYGGRPFIPNDPAMPPNAVNYLRNLLRSAKVYLEYGSGGSTILASTLGVEHIVSAESDATWLDAVQQKIERRRNGAKQHFHPVHIDIGPTKEWGFPKNENKWKSYPQYPLNPWLTCQLQSLMPDVILIDGRFRVACFATSLIMAKVGTRVLFDDYSDRSFYHVVESMARVEKLHDRLAEFIVPENLDHKKVIEILLKHSNDAR